MNSSIRFSTSQRMTKTFNLIEKYKQRLNIFTYLIQNCNKLTDLMFCFLFLIDLCIVLILPFEIVIDFSSQHHIVNDIERFMKFNYFYVIEHSNLLQYITDGINVYLFMLLAFILYIFLKHDFQLSNLKDNQTLIITIFSFLIMLTGRYLAYGILVFQIIAIRCAFSCSVCSETTDQGRLYSNSIGVVITVMFMYI